MTVKMQFDDTFSACATSGNHEHDHAVLKIKQKHVTTACVFDQLGVAGTEQVKGRGQADD